MIDLSAPSIYERVINEKDTEQIRLVINTFRGVEYLSLRKYYLDFDEEWVHLRKSNTEPIIRIYAESKSLEKATSLASRFVDEVKKIM